MVSGHQEALLKPQLKRSRYTPPPPYEPGNADKLESTNFENSALFLVSSFQYVLTAAVFSIGPPFRKPMRTNGRVFVHRGGYHELTHRDWILRLACVLARHPRPDKHSDPAVTSEICRDLVGVDDTPVLCAYHALGRSWSEHHFLSDVRALGRAISRTGCGIFDKDVPGAPPHSTREGL